MKKPLRIVFGMETRIIRIYYQLFGFFKAVAPKKSTFIFKQIMCQLPFCRYKSMMTVSRTADRSVTRYIPA